MMLTELKNQLGIKAKKNRKKQLMSCDYLFLYFFGNRNKHNKFTFKLEKK